MKTKEELLKIYSAYLPYQLKCEYDFESIITKHSEKRIGKLLGLREQPFHSVAILVDNKPNNPDYIKHSKVKPILYSIEFLTKEIEHNGEVFIPIERLFDIETGINWSASDYIKSGKGQKGYWVRSKDEGKSFYFGFNSDNNYFYHVDSYGFKMTIKKQLELLQKLFEWHFNVFGLDESEYIKKENLNRSENPNS